MPDNRLIVALDLPNAAAASEIVDQLGDSVGFYKIGLGMLTGGGLALAGELKDNGKRVFLDMKFATGEQQQARQGERQAAENYCCGQHGQHGHRRRPSPSFINV